MTDGQGQQLKKSETASGAGYNVLASQKKALEMTLRGAPLNAILDVLVEEVELHAGEPVYATILLVDPTGKYLKIAAAPALPPEYAVNFDGLPIAPTSASCGAAAYRRTPVIVAAIADDPLWDRHKALALAHGLRACWSTPILATDGRVLGTFAVYFRAEKTPNARQKDLVELAISTATLVIERQIEQKERAELEEWGRQQSLALLRAKEDAEHANRLKSAFLANMSHEIRTPLGAILGFAGLLRDAEISAEDRREYLNSIHRNGQALMRIIDDILDLAKVEANRLDIEEAVFSLFDLMSEVTEMFRERAKTKGIYLLLTIAEDVPNHVRTDPTRLRQIILNVVGNAVKFTDQGGVRVTVRLVGAQSEVVTLQVEVRDTGRGLTPEQQSRLFEPFSQADSETSRKFGGTGLGLALSRRLAEALGGTVAISDVEPNKGCTFVITFRATKSEAEHGVAVRRLTPPSEPATTFSLAGLRILVVDDAIDNRLYIQRTLAKLGSHVDLASDGADGVMKAQAGLYDLVLMDIQMPGLDGYEATRQLLAAGFRTPIVALTAHAMTEEKARTEAAGFAAHLTKPMVIADLLQLIERLVINRARP